MQEYIHPIARLAGDTLSEDNYFGDTSRWNMVYARETAREKMFRKLIEEELPSFPVDLIRGDERRLERVAAFVMLRKNNLLLQRVLTNHLFTADMISMYLMLGGQFPKRPYSQRIMMTDLLLDINDGMIEGVTLKHVNALLSAFEHPDVTWEASHGQSNKFLDRVVDDNFTFYADAQHTNIRPAADGKRFRNLIYLSGMSGAQAEQFLSSQRMIARLIIQMGSALHRGVFDAFFEDNGIDKKFYAKGYSNPDFDIQLMIAALLNKNVIGKFIELLNKLSMQMESSRQEQILFAQFANVLENCVAQPNARDLSASIGTAFTAQENEGAATQTLLSQEKLSDAQLERRRSAIRKGQEELASIAIDEQATYEGRKPEMILQDAIASKQISMIEITKVVNDAQLSLDDLVLWFFHYNRLVQKKDVKYSEIYIPGEFLLFEKNKLIHRFMYQVARDIGYSELLTSFNTMMQRRWMIEMSEKQMLSAQLSEALPTRAVQCPFCGTVITVSVSQGALGIVDNVRDCPGCAQKSEFVPLGKETPRLRLKTFDASTARSLAVPSKLTEFREYLAETMTWDDLRLWVSRLYTNGILTNKSKLPYEAIEGHNRTMSLYCMKIIEAIGRVGADLVATVDFLQPRAGNRYTVNQLEAGSTRLCFCADCKDVWLQPMGGVGLQRQTENPVFDDQTYDINRVQCGHCHSHNVHNNASEETGIVPTDVKKQLGNLSEYATESELYTAANQIYKFLAKHFSIDEMKNLVVSISHYLKKRRPNLSLHPWGQFENIPSQNSIDFAREFAMWAKRQGALPYLVEFIAQYQFDSARNGAKVAVQCSHCGTIAVTSLNESSLVVLKYCNSCLAIDGWKLLPTPIADLRVTPYDMTESYARNSGHGGPSSSGQTQDSVVLLHASHLT